MLVEQQVVHMMEVLFDVAVCIAAVDVHPLVEVMLHMRAQQRQAEQEHPRIGGAEVFISPPHGGSPARVRDVVEQGPETSADQERQEKVKCEQPRVGIGALDFLGAEKQQIKADDGPDGGDGRGDGFHLRYL